MNLLEDAWLPVRRQDGAVIRVSPAQLSDPDIVSFDAERPDFNGALAQFAIGLLQTTSPVDSPIQWRAWFERAPAPATLREWFAPHAQAFQLDGDGARFLQDFDLRGDDGDPVGIAGLLIDAPGENAVRNNSDHFIKRGQGTRFCPCCAATALFTLQVNAPAGGAGHRTGLRGGGPLTTLLLAERDGGTPTSLWHHLWLNVQQRQHLLGNGGDPGKTAPHYTFPWLASNRAIQKEGGETAPIQVHPAHVFWAMPRRIRLDFENTSSGRCSLCGRESDRLVHQYVTRNYGLNYKGPWKHPLSPYNEAKDGWLPLHPQPGGIGYRHWLGWVMGMQSDKRKLEAAAVVNRFLSSGIEQRARTRLRLWAFGYDMDNMKARCWYDATLPLYTLADCAAEARAELRDDVGDWLAGAELVAGLLRGAVKDAWFSGDARGDFSFVDSCFWSRTEPGFYALLGARINAAGGAGEWDRLAAAQQWLKVISSAALVLFDDQLVGAGPVDRQNPRRVAQARRLLRLGLAGPKLREALRLPATEQPRAAKRTKATA